MTLEQQPFEDVFPSKEFAIFSTYVSYQEGKIILGGMMMLEILNII